MCAHVFVGKVLYAQVTRVLGGRASRERGAADNCVVSADDFQLPSAKYEIIALPISAAKLRRGKKTKQNTGG